MKTINYTGNSKLISRIVHLLNRKAPLPLDGQGDAVWGTNGQVLTTDGNGNTSWTTPQGGGGDVTDVEVNGTSVVNAQGVAEVSVPTATSDLNNDSGFITNLVNNLANYYTKSQTYTQAEVDALISGIVTLNILVVQALPTQDISTTTIYLVPKQDTGTSDIYDEYLYINNTWELIGTTQIDLSNYVTTTDLSTALADYVTSVGLATILAGYVQSADLATVATSGDYSDLQNKPTIPDELADLTDDSTHRTVTDTQISTWNGKSDFSGSYNDLTDKPTIPTVNDGTLTIQQNGTTLGTFTANQSGNTTVNLTGGGGSTYTEGDGIDISAQDVISVDTTFTEASTRANIASGDKFSTILGKIKKFFTDLKTVAFTGSYNDLSDKPTIPSVGNGTLTIQKNGTNVQTFTANQSGNATVNITVPTNTNELTNGAGFITSSGSCAYATSAGSAVDQAARDAANAAIMKRQYYSENIANVGGGGTHQYVLIATLTVTGTYSDGDIMFEVSQRYFHFSRLLVNVSPSNSIYSFTTDNDNHYYLYPKGNKVYELYAHINYTWGALSLHRISGFRYNNGVDVVVNMTKVSSIPSGAVQASSTSFHDYKTSSGTKRYNIAMTGDGMMIIHCIQSGSSNVRASIVAGGTITNLYTYGSVATIGSNYIEVSAQNVYVDITSTAPIRVY